MFWVIAKYDLCCIFVCSVYVFFLSLILNDFAFSKIHNNSNDKNGRK